nr:hypothetical protein [Tanacetum cinerariifolium]
MDTPLDFSNFLINRLKVDTLTPELLAGLTYELMKGSCKSLESACDVYSKRRIIVVTKLKIVEWHCYKHLNWITVRRDNDKLYKFKEGDLKRLCIQDIKDMSLLLIQGKLTNLTVEEDDCLKGIQMQYLPQSIWRKCDKDRAAAMIQAIDKRLKTRRIMRSLERPRPARAGTPPLRAASPRVCRRRERVFEFEETQNKRESRFERNIKGGRPSKEAPREWKSKCKPSPTFSSPLRVTREWETFAVFRDFYLQRRLAKIPPIERFPVRVYGGKPMGCPLTKLSGCWWGPWEMLLEVVECQLWQKDPNRDGERGFDYLTSTLVSSKAHRERCRASRCGFRTGNHPEYDFTPFETIRRLFSVFGRRSHLGFEGETSEPKGMVRH